MGRFLGYQGLPPITYLIYETADIHRTIDEQIDLFDETPQRALT